MERFEGIFKYRHAKDSHERRKNCVKQSKMDIEELGQLYPDLFYFCLFVLEDICI